MKSICFVSTLAYPLFNPSVSDSVGGAETQQKILAEELVRRRYSVSFVVGDYGQDAIEEVGNIRLFKCKTAKNRNTLLNIPGTYRSLAKAMKAADADLYTQRTNPFYTGQVALWCKMRGKRFVYFTGHDSNCDVSFLPKPMNSLVFLAYKMGLNIADEIVVQSKAQQEMLRKNFSHESTIIRSLFNKSSVTEESINVKQNKVISVGTMLPKKRPEIFIELAGYFPNIEFHLIGSGKKDYVNKLRHDSAESNNVKFLGTLKNEKLAEEYRSAKALIMTSSAEGFPNVFLEAWHYGTPILSLGIDPDGLLSMGAGLKSDSFEELKAALTKLLEDEQLGAEFVTAGRKILKDEFNFSNSVDSILKVTGLA